MEEKRQVKAHIFSLHDLPHDRDSRYVPQNRFKAFASNKAAFLLSVVKAAFSTQTIIISHIHLLFVAALIRRFAPNTRIIMFAHGIEVWRSIPDWKRRFLMRHTTIWAVSHYTKDKMIEMHGLLPANIFILPNCLDPFLEIPESFDKPPYLLDKYKLDAEQPILFTLTRLANSEAYKGYDQVLRSMPSLLKVYPTLQYFIAGKADKQEKERITNLIDDLKIRDNVRLLGFLPYEDITDHFLLADVFVMPSRKEGFGIVFIEAAACGCKVIGGNQDGSPDALLNGKLGTLVDPTNVEEIESAVLENLTLPVLRNQSAGIQKRCLEAFNFHQYQSNIEALLLN
ncbi:MAG: hypothetical protein K0S09_3172 [Sphingobacteriaceae bacterium]|jgi:glycosyltransferase involved in cell wall biosynthesis|nr:hypothetical protein [Sphingobacteriaceae bacterium]